MMLTERLSQCTTQIQSQLQHFIVDAPIERDKLIKAIVESSETF